MGTFLIIVVVFLVVLFGTTALILKANKNKKNCSCGYKYTPDDIIQYDDLAATGKEIMGEQAFFVTLTAKCPKCNTTKTFRAIVSYYPRKERVEDGICRFLNK